MTPAEKKPSKRLAFLEKITSEGSDDPLAWYGLAMEYRSLARWEDSLKTFEALRARRPDYVALYLMCGQMLVEAGRNAESRTWLEQGVVEAKKKGDSHAISELEAALGSLS